MFRTLLKHRRTRVAFVLLCSAVPMACGGGNGATAPDSDPPSEVATVEVNPSSETAKALEEEIQFSATARSDDGGSVSGVSFTWSSSNSDVAEVQDDGTAIARANGIATITARAEGVEGDATLTVDQEVDRVSIAPGADTLEAGDEQQLEAEARDANGHPVADVEGFEWSSSDLSVAEVDPTGLVTAVSDGDAEIRATVEGVTGTAELRVLGEGTPTVRSVTPETLPEGGRATLDGDDFATSAADNAVTVDGAAAEVLSATATELEIRVPTYDCRPAREVEIRVTVDGKESIPATAGLEPDEAALTPATGVFDLRRDPGAFCLQFAATDASESYLVGIQSADEARPLDLTSARVTASAAGPASAGRARLPAAVSATSPARTGAGGTAFFPGVEPRARGHVSAPGRTTVRRARGGGELQEPARQVGPNPTEGEMVELLVPGPGCQDSTPVEAEVRAVSEHAVILGDVENPEDGYTEANVDSMAALFDDYARPTVVEHLGEPTDLDDNGRTVFLVSKAVNETRGVPGGFVRFGDLRPSPRCTANGGEYVYFSAPDPEGAHGRAWTAQEALALHRRTLSHEFAHVVQLGHRIRNGIDPMPLWMGEGQALLAEELTGHAVTGREARQNYGPEDAFIEPGGTRWYASKFPSLDEYLSDDDGTPHRCTWLAQVQPFPEDPCERAPSAGMGWSFLRWVTDQFGPDMEGGPAGLQRALVDNDVIGLANVADVTGVPAAELVARWAAVLYLDDRPAATDELRFPSWDLRAILSDPSAPWGSDGMDFRPPERTFGEFEETVEVRPASSAYFLLSGDGRPATAVQVRSETGGEAPDHLQVWVVRVE